MKAAVLHGMNDLRWENVATPRIGPDEILLRVKATGICGSDFPRVLGNGAHFYPIILGHEFSGVVVEAGKDVAGIRPGARMTAAPLLPCFRCSDCAQGHYSLCRNYRFIGSRVSGSWAQYVKIPAINAVALPEEISFEAGALFEPTTVALHGLLLMKLPGGIDVAVVGIGTIGLLTLQCAKALGARRAFAFDIDPHRLEIAREYGADFCYNTGDPGFRDQLRADLNGADLPAVIETAGVEFTEKLCLELAANRGKVMFIGTPTRNITLSPREFEQINRKELTVGGSWMSYSAPFPGREWSLAVHLFQNGRIRYQELIDHRLPLSRIAEVFAALSVPGNVKGKIMLEGE